MHAPAGGKGMAQVECSKSWLHLQSHLNASCAEFEESGTGDSIVHVLSSASVGRLRDIQDILPSWPNIFLKEKLQVGWQHSQGKRPLSWEQDCESQAAAPLQAPAALPAACRRRKQPGRTSQPRPGRCRPAAVPSSWPQGHAEPSQYGPENHGPNQARSSWYLGFYCSSAPGERLYASLNKERFA